MRDAIETSDARVFVKGYRELLDSEEERALFQAWWDTNPEGHADLLDPDSETNRFSGGDDNKYLTRIILAYGPVIKRAMKELSAYKVDQEELRSEGLMALAEAARRYAPSAHDNTRFAAYAKVCVKGMMQGWIMRNYFMVQFATNRSKKRLFYGMRKRVAISIAQTGKFKMTDEIVTELSEEFGVDPSDVWQMHEMFLSPYQSLDATVYPNHDGDPMLLVDTLECDEETEEAVMQVDTVRFHRRLVNEAMNNTLTPREKTVFIAQELSEKEDVRTLENLAEEFECSRERIRQVRNQATRKVKEEILRLAVVKKIAIKDMFV